MKLILLTLLLSGAYLMLSEFEPYRIVLAAASNSEYLEDLKIASRLEVDVRKSYESLMHALNSLQSDKVIAIVNGRLVLLESQNYDWLLPGLRYGDQIAWDIVGIISHKNQKFRIDQNLLAQIGSDGEDYIVTLLRNQLPDQLKEKVIRHSLVDDSLGFDISSPTPDGQSRYLFEVKTSTQFRESFEFYFTRNEWEAAQREKNWFIVFVRKINGSFSVFGHLDGRSLATYFPRDSHPNFRWSVSKGVFSSSDVFDHLPLGYP